MKKTILVAVIFLVFIACHKKSIPTITDRESAPMEQTKDVVTVTADVATGKILFTNRCGRCHGLPEPAEHTVAKWDKVMLRMAPLAKLDANQAAHVTAYVKSLGKE